MPVCRPLDPKPAIEAATAPVFSESGRIGVKRMESTDKGERPWQCSGESAGEIEIRLIRTSGLYFPEPDLFIRLEDNASIDLAADMTPFPRAIELVQKQESIIYQKRACIQDGFYDGVSCSFMDVFDMHIGSFSKNPTRI